MLRIVCWPRAHGWLAILLGLLVSGVLATVIRVPTAAQQIEPERPAAAAIEVPEGQTYVGTKECAACHFDQFMAWRQTPHAKAFEILPAKYQSDVSCLKCHTTGHGQPTGFTSLQETPNLVGNSCEGCHGPGSKHTEVATSLAKQKLTPEQEAQVRGTIHLMLPKNVCVECHLATAHKAHPAYDK